MEEQRLNSLEEILQEPKKVVIIPHINPDGDAMGSCLGLYNFLNKLNHYATVIAPNDYPEFLKWLPGSAEVFIFENQKEESRQLINDAELIFTLDFNSFSRVGGEMADVLSEVESVFVMIDHHQQPDDYADFMYSDVHTSSTCELVYDFINRLNLIHFIDQDIATCLYAGIMTDTGSFRFPSTSSNTHRIIADLIDRGAKNDQIHQNIFDSKSAEQLKLLGVALQNLQVFEDYKTALITLSQEDLDQHSFKKGDTEGFVNFGLSLTGIIFALIFIENKNEGIIKISLRSKGDFDVNQFARKYFNGGGHINAAGGRSEASMEETIENLQEYLRENKALLNK